MLLCCLNPYELSYAILHREYFNQAVVFMKGNLNFGHKDSCSSFSRIVVLPVVFLVFLFVFLFCTVTNEIKLKKFLE